MAKTRNIKVTIGGPESPSGTAAARQYVVPVRGVPGLEKTPEKAMDPANLGLGMDHDEFVVAEDDRGPIQLAFRPCGGIGQILKSLLGDEEVPFKVGACVRVMYIGSEDSCKLVPANGPVTVLCGAGGAGNTNYDAAYFLLTNGITTWYVWTDINNGSTDPGDPGEALAGLGYTGAEVDITDVNTTDQIATAIEAVVEALTGINSTVLASTVSITSASAAYQVGGETGSAVFTVTGTGTLTSSIGDLGSEAVDAAFGVAGVLDLALAANDTVAELVSVIDAYADYEAELVWTHPTKSASTMKSGNIMLFTSPANNRQGKNTWAYIWIGLPSSTRFKHEFQPALSDATELPTYSMQIDALEDNYLHDGVVADSFSLNGTLKAMVEAEVQFLAMKETGSQVASVLTNPDVDPLMFWNGSTWYGALDYSPFLRKISLQFSNNHIADTFGQGVITRSYQQKSNPTVSGDFTVKLDTTNTLAERLKSFTNTKTALSFFFKDGASEDLCLVEIPFCTTKKPEREENSGVLDAKIPFTGLKPKGTLYNDPMTITILTTDSVTY